ncbi:MAG: Hsp20/alpha crystallin family protein [Promethearchaeota archaeon]
MSDAQLETTPTYDHVHRVMPKYGVWTNEDNVVIQIALPGVKKKDIELKALPDYFMLRAPRANMIYNLDLEFGFKLEPEVHKATYEEGLLRVELKRYQPLEHAFEVKIE